MPSACQAILAELVVQNLVIVGNARLSPGQGLTVISGETGAGKSLILDALSLLLGDRAQGNLIGGKSDSATVSAVFTIDRQLSERIEATCGVSSSDQQLIVRRKLSANGRSQAWVNDVPVTVAALRAISDELVDVHAQHEAQRLNDPARQVALLDAFGKLDEQAVAYREVHKRCLDLAGELHRLDHDERESVKELDYLRFQVREFEALTPKSGELAELEQRHAALSGVEQWQQLAGQAAQVIADGERSVAQTLALWARKLGEAPDPRLAQAAAACAQARDLVVDAGAHCNDALERLQADPGALKTLQERLDAYYELMRKHGNDEAALMAAWEKTASRVKDLEGLDERRAKLAADLESARAKRATSGAALAKARTAAFNRLAKIAQDHLADLGMPKAKLSLANDAGGEPGPLGTVKQELLICANPGLEPCRLADAASGGESARLMLALAVALAEHDRTGVLVFDEVDSGVGGRLGAAIGAKLNQLARGRTVIAITHTPQLAAVADKQYVVRKKQGERSTSVEVEELSGEARTAEIAEMLGGGQAARTQAKALLTAGRS